MRQLGIWLVVGASVLGFGSTRLHAGTLQTPNLDTLLDAIATAESQNGLHQLGDGGRALGPYQIHRDYWRDGTRILGVDWGYENARDPVKAREIVRAYVLYYGKGKSLIELARIHNGGPDGDKKASTLRYASKIAKLLAARGNAA